MKQFLILIVLVSTTQITAQNLDPGNYIYPVLNVAGYHSASFGEMRPNHFHGGIDIKTEGKEGYPLVAVADGYISRISVTAGGYGRALYLTLNNGTTAVYGHISRFSKPIEEYVRNERLRLRKNAVQLYPAGGLFRVQQGDTIAYSGNSGSSFGPHLHFELRDTPSQKTLNMVRQGIARPKDTVSPLMMKLHYIEIDTLDGIPVQAPLRSYAVVKREGAGYRLAQQEPVGVGRNGYFVLEASDRRNDVQNTFGLYRVTAEIDGDPFFEYRMDGFSFDQSLYCNIASYYPIQINTRNEAIRLAIPEDCTEDFCPMHQQRGAICVAPGAEHTVRIEAEDDCGNTSQLQFRIRGRAETFRAAADSTLVSLYRNRTNTVRIASEVTASIPTGALYESTRCYPEIRAVKLPTDTSIMILTPVYRILSPETPLHKPMQVTIRAFVPQTVQSHVALATRTRKGTLSYIGGSYADGQLTANTRTTGDLLLVADTMPPTVTPLFKPDTDLRPTDGLRFRVSDNFSGIASCALYIDGEWTPCDRYPMKGTLHAPFITPPSGNLHRAKLIVSDNCGNTTTWEGVFKR